METSRLLLVIVGDVDAAEMQKQVAAAFGILPRGSYRDAPPEPVTFAKPGVDVISKPLETDYIKGTFAAPPIGSPDYYAMRTAISVLASVWLMLNLPVITWVRFLIWMAAGLLLYFVYGMRRANLAADAGEARLTAEGGRSGPAA